jgi:hypothetical protein
MEGGVDVNARSNLRIIADGNEVTVKEHAPIVDEAVATKSDVRTVIARDRSLDLRTIPDLLE